MKEKFKFENIEGALKGQAFNHALPMTRNWDDTLDTIHYLLLKKWYYVAIATNTKRGGKLLKNGLGLERKRKSLPEEMQTILKLKISSFEGLKKKIRQKQLKSGEDRDVWHFSSQWKEFPEGTKVIELTQANLSGMVKSKGATKICYIVLDGKATTVDVNTCMFIVHKVFSDKAYAAKVLKEVEKLKKQGGPAGMEPQLKKAVDIRGARQPGTVMMELRDHPKEVENVTDAEWYLLQGYFEKLKESSQLTDMHIKVEQLLKLHFGEKALRGG